MRYKSSLVRRCVLLRCLADVRKTALVAIWLAGGTHSASVQNQTVAEIRGCLRRDDGEQGFFHLGGIFDTVYETDAVGKADAVRIGDDGRLVKNIAEDQVSGLPTDAGDFQQLLHCAGDDTVVVLQQILCGGVNIARFGIAQSAGANDFFDLCGFGLREGFQCRKDAVQLLRDDIHAGVGTLCGKAGGKQQLIILFIGQCANGIGIFLLQQDNGALGAFFGCQYHNLLAVVFDEKQRGEKRSAESISAQIVCRTKTVYHILRCDRIVGTIKIPNEAHGKCTKGEEKLHKVLDRNQRNVRQEGEKDGMEENHLENNGKS